MSQQTENFFEPIHTNEQIPFKYQEDENLTNEIVELLESGKKQIYFGDDKKDNVIYAKKFLYMPQKFQIAVLKFCNDQNFLKKMIRGSIYKCQFKLMREILEKTKGNLPEGSLDTDEFFIADVDAEFLGYLVDNNFYKLKKTDFKQLQRFQKLNHLEVFLERGFDFNSYDGFFWMLCDSDKPSILQTLNLCNKYQKPIDLKKKFSFDECSRFVCYSRFFYGQNISKLLDDEETRNKSGFGETTIANFAVEHNQKYIIDALLEYGIKINDLKKNYLTPENRDMIKKLL